MKERREQQQQRQQQQPQQSSQQETEHSLPASDQSAVIPAATVVVPGLPPLPLLPLPPSPYHHPPPPPLLPTPSPSLSTCTSCSSFPHTPSSAFTSTSKSSLSSHHPVRTTTQTLSTTGCLSTQDRVKIFFEHSDMLSGSDILIGSDKPSGSDSNQMNRKYLPVKKGLVGNTKESETRRVLGTSEYEEQQRGGGIHTRKIASTSSHEQDSDVPSTQPPTALMKYQYSLPEEDTVVSVNTGASTYPNICV